MALNEKIQDREARRFSLPARKPLVIDIEI
jgi:hypothetical protein